jgi:cytochrome c biogenesis protein CcdA
LILATILPVSIWQGTIYLLAYVIGLGLVLFLIARLGERFSARLGRLASDEG